MDESIIYLIQIILLITYKITALIVGYFIIKLGFGLIKSGIEGDFKFTTSFKGFKGGLVSSSPGLLFVLLGTALMIFSIYVEKETDYKRKEIKESTEANNDEFLDNFANDTIQYEK